MRIVMLVLLKEGFFTAKGDTTATWIWLSRNLVVLNLNWKY